MRHIIIGLGSIGRRHYRNLIGLGRGHEVITVDSSPNASADLVSWDWLDYESNDVVYICTPTEHHYRNMFDAVSGGVKAVFVEKPIVSISNRDLEIEDEHYDVFNKVMCSYQYRYHPVFRSLKRNSPVDILVMTAQDDLVSRYGPTALETMASHSIDIALWVNGPAESWDTIDSGEYCSVQISHTNGCLSQIRCNISKSPRISNISYRRAGYRFQTSVPANDQMYIDEMKAWLHFLNTGERGDLCFYEDAMKVQEIMIGSSHD